MNDKEIVDALMGAAHVAVIAQDYDRVKSLLDRIVAILDRYVVQIQVKA